MTVSPGARTDVDADLVEALRREEPEAAEQLVERFGDRVYRLAQRITGVKEDAEEAAQDALWTAARKIGTFKGESAFGSWLYRIAANAAYQKLRSRRGKAVADPGAQQVNAEGHGEQDKQAELADRVDQAGHMGGVDRVVVVTDEAGDGRQGKDDHQEDQ